MIRVLLVCCIFIIASVAYAEEQEIAQVATVDCSGLDFAEASKLVEEYTGFECQKSPGPNDSSFVLDTLNIIDHLEPPNIELYQGHKVWSIQVDPSKSSDTLVWSGVLNMMKKWQLEAWIDSNSGALIQIIGRRSQKFDSSYQYVKYIDKKGSQIKEPPILGLAQVLDHSPGGGWAMHGELVQIWLLDMEDSTGSKRPVWIFFGKGMLGDFRGSGIPGCVTMGNDATSGLCVIGYEFCTGCIDPESRSDQIVLPSLANPKASEE